MHFRRVIVEQVGQGLTVATGLLDRLVLTAVLVRLWGNARFETWAACIAAAGLVSLFEFGFSLYFNNRLMEEAEQERHIDAVRTLFLANTLFSSVGTLSFLVVSVMTLFSWIGGLPSDPAAKAAVIVLAAGQSLRIAASGYIYLYRANREYSRLIFSYAAGELARVVASILACVVGGGLLAVAIAGTAVAAGFQSLFPVVDGLRRFAPRSVGFAIPLRGEVWPVLRTSSGFFAQSVPTVLLTSVPVLYLVGQNVGAGIVASFVLMRTLSSVPRVLLQQFGTVLGQECGRRIAIRDGAGAIRIVAEGARLYSVTSGIATGLLLGAGFEVTRLWTGKADYFRFDYLAAAVVPMVLGAVSVLALNILANTNAPFFATAGRWVQLGLTVVCVAFLPVQDLGLAVLIALSVGEIVGFVPLACRGVARLVPGTDVWFYTKETLISVCAAAASTGLTLAVLRFAPLPTPAGRIVAIGLAVVINGVLIPWLGIRAQTRRDFLEQFVHPALVSFKAMRLR